MKRIACNLLGIAFIGAGALHFVSPDFYLPMMPPYLPCHLELIYVSGLFEILGGVGVLVARTRRIAGLGLIALLVAVSPANLHVALNGIAPPGMDASPIALWLRLPLQLVFIGWAWWASND